MTKLSDVFGESVSSSVKLIPKTKRFHKSSRSERIGSTHSGPYWEENLRLSPFWARKGYDKEPKLGMKPVVQIEGDILRNRAFIPGQKVTSQMIQDLHANTKYIRISDWREEKDDGGMTADDFF